MLLGEVFEKARAVLEHPHGASNEFDALQTAVDHATKTLFDHQIGAAVKYRDTAGRIHDATVTGQGIEAGYIVYDVTLENTAKKWGYADQIEAVKP